MADAIFCFIDTKQITELFTDFLVANDYITDPQTAHEIAKDYVENFSPDELMFL